MTLDQRLRDGIRRAIEPIDPPVDPRLERSLRRGRRLLAARWIAGLGSLMVLTISLVVAGPAFVKTTPVTMVRPAGSPSMASVATSPLEGHRSTRAITRAHESQVLREAGFTDADVRAFMRDQGARRTIRFLVTFDGTRFTTTASPDGAPASEIDRGAFSFRDGVLTLQHRNGGRTRLQLWFAADRIAFTFVDDTRPDHDGYPAALFATGIYAAAPFVSQG